MRVESVYRFATPKYIVHVWRSEPDDFQYRIRGVTEIEVAVHKNQDLPLGELAGLLAGLKDVVRVQIVDWSLNGVVLYGDKHE
jgi:hypothetical protein